MKTFDWLRTLLALGLLWTSLERPAAAAPTATMVSVKPPSGTYDAGEMLLVEVWVEDVADLYGADIQLKLDPARLEVQDANPSLGGVQVTPRSDLLAPNLVVIKTANNISGTVQYAVSQADPSPPVSGSGALFAFTVEMLSAGTANLTITSQTLSNINAEAIPAGSNSASYLIEAGGSLPYKIYLPTILRTSASAAQ